jgi:hypothetical protein
MHPENAKKLARTSPEWLELLPDVPQALMAAPQPRIAAANLRPREEDGRIASTVVLLAGRA